MANDKSIFDKTLPYIVGIMLAVMGFLSQQVYAELKSKPSKAEVKVIIEERIKPLETCMNENTSKITSFEATLKSFTIMNAAILRIDIRTIKQGEDIAEIKGRVLQE